MELNSEMFSMTFTHFKTYVVHTFKNEKSETARKKFFVNLKELSADGMVFASEFDLDADDGFEFVFTRGKHPIVVDFKITRKSTTPKGSFLYECNFEDIENVKEQVLRVFVFRKQLV